MQSAVEIINKAEDDLNVILQAGLSTASAINQQPWHFAVITNQDVMKEIGGMGDSPAALIVYMNEGTPSSDERFDCGLATQNMVIAANALGYGAKIVSASTMTLNGKKHG